MIEFTVETEIARPPSEVFAYVADPAKLSTWQTNTVSAVAEDDGPVRLGTRLREVHSAPGGKQMTSLVEVSEYEPDRVFALRMLEGALPIHARITFEPTALGTRVRFTAHGQPSGAMRLGQPLLRLVLKRQFAGYCATLKRVLERTGG
ncbi:MAG TPA: SRPBCC family protein [Solirubrobacteraceae bacterium]|nr:SRPBCC family protein [Solirubrobacteraceae bacterium]